MARLRQETVRSLLCGLKSTARCAAQGRQRGRDAPLTLSSVSSEGVFAWFVSSGWLPAPPRGVSARQPPARSHSAAPAGPVRAARLARNHPFRFRVGTDQGPCLPAAHEFVPPPVIQLERVRSTTAPDGSGPPFAAAGPGFAASRPIGQAMITIVKNVKPSAKEVTMSFIQPAHIQQEGI